MVLDDLKAQIERIEGRTKRFTAVASAREHVWTSGLKRLDAALPGTALSFDACHDFTPSQKTDVAQTAGFILALLQRLPPARLQRGPVVWCQTAFNAREYGRIYAPSLLGKTVSPHHMLFVNVPKDRDMTLVLEECVRVPRVAAVIGEGPAPDFTASRRLTLASQKSHVPCLILNTSGIIGASAAETRWRIAPIAGPPDPRDPKGPGFAAWEISLARSRGANAALNPTLARPLKVTWNDETHTFHMVSAFRHGTHGAGQTTPDTAHNRTGQFSKN